MKATVSIIGVFSIRPFISFPRSVNELLFENENKDDLVIFKGFAEFNKEKLISEGNVGIFGGISDRYGVSGIEGEIIGNQMSFFKGYINTGIENKGFIYSLEKEEKEEFGVWQGSWKEKDSNNESCGFVYLMMFE